MIGLLMIALATAFREISASIGKTEVNAHRESIYTMGFLTLLWGALMLFGTGLFRKELTFSLASLPTFSLRLILEIAQVHISMKAIAVADRSTYGFIRIWTIPLLLLVDIFLAYPVTTLQTIGISLIVLSFIFLFINHGIRKKGAGLVAFSAINAVATISLYKYNITHFNSVEAEQSIILAVVLLYLMVMAFFVAKENPVRFLTKPIFLTQSLASGVGTVLVSFSYLFAPASIITTGKRSFAIMWAMLSGNMYFQEKKLLVKAVSLALIVSGLVLLII